MKLRGIDFGKVLGASGVQGFFGEGYQYQDFLKAVGLLKMDGITFVAKTATLNYNKGNMPLRKDLRPQKWLPSCIWVNIFQGTALNAVGLSNPGADALLQDGRWQRRSKPFMISFMAIGKTREERLQEAKLFVKLLKAYLSELKGRIAIQINFSCPNTGHDPKELIAEIKPTLDIFAELDVPLLVKVNPLVSDEEIMDIALHPACDGFCLFNTIPFGEGDDVDWARLFPDGSPLIGFGSGGGLSGTLLTSLTLKRIEGLYGVGMRKAMIAHSMMSREDVLTAWRSGASAVAIGTVVPTRFWRVRSMVKAANEAFD